MIKRTKSKKKAKATPACGTCTYWRTENVAADVTGAEQGHCHRFPPPQVSPGTGPWPMTIASDWCGEYKSAPGP